MAAKCVNNDVISRSKNLILHNQTMTLATATGNSAWATPVFFVNRGPCFYFFSSPDSRHIREGLSSETSACSIYADESAWQSLSGLQMSGTIHLIPSGREASLAVIAYVKKFPLVQSFFSGIRSIGLNDFLCKFHAKLYCFKPELIFFMDNSVHFGFRKEIERKALFK